MPNTELTDKERIALLSNEEKGRLYYDKMKDVLQLIDLTQTKMQSYTTYSRDNLRTYLKNPASESNQKNLRKLSNYLYTVSHVYRRLINFKAGQITLKNWIVYPDVTITKKPSKKTVLSGYERVTKYIKKMNMSSQISKCMLQAWRGDTVYCFCYGDPDKNGEFFMHVLDPEYCKISSQQYYSGVTSFAFDFSFFSGTNSFYLDVYDPIFKQMYQKYQSDSQLRWQELPIENTFCIKINVDNMDYPVPPLSGLFQSCIDLVDLENIQNIKSELEATKLVYAKIDTLKTNQVDDFEIDLDLANAFYEKILPIMPETVGFAMSPMKLESLDFATNTANDTNMIEDAYENLISAYGGIVLNHNKITNSASFMQALRTDCLDAMAPVEQINAWINLWIKNHLGETGMIVEYSNVSPYFVDSEIEKLMKLGQYGVPVKLKLSSLADIDPVKERGMSFMEDALGLGTTSWIHPLVSSNTQSGITDNGDGSEGAPKKDDGELSDEGQNDRDKK